MVYPPKLVERYSFLPTKTPAIAARGNRAIGASLCLIELTAGEAFRLFDAFIRSLRITMNRLRSLSAALCCALLLGAAAPRMRAQTVVDNFNDGSDSAWTHYNPLGNGIYSFPDGDTYSIQAPQPGTSAFGPARAGSYLTGSDYGDFQISVDLVSWDNSANTHQAIGIFARATQIGLGTTDGYFFHYDPHGTNGGSSIWIDPIGSDAPFGGVSVSIPALDSAASYRLQFTGVGNVLTGDIFALNNLSTPLYEVTLTDSTYASGALGLLAADQGALQTGNQSAAATFDNFEVSAVPEPSTTALLVGVSSLVAGMIWRRKLPA
jgi:hypothetical protein